MYDTVKISVGLLLFLGVVTLPFWIHGGKDQPMPKPVVLEGAESCIEPTEWMRANHMLLLDEWRNSVVRENNHTYTNSQGKQFQKSLTKTCLDCHSNKEQFCDQCHKAVAVELYCFNCHLEPKKMPGQARPESHPVPEAVKQEALRASLQPEPEEGRRRDG